LLGSFSDLSSVTTSHVFDPLQPNRHTTRS
jgi:hypothetical protein